ncbi:MAG: Hpt domain-containing protein, partial [Desulfosarcina sp.]
FNNDGVFFKDVAEMFIIDYPPMVETVRKAVAEKDRALLRRTAHALKGMALNFQIEKAADAARQLEQLAGDGAFDNAWQLCRTLAEALAAFEGRLKRMVAGLT